MSKANGCEKCGTTEDIDRVGLLHAYIPFDFEGAAIVDVTARRKP